MTGSLADRGVLIALSGLAALLLSIYPLPVWLQPARPDWLALFVIYWTLHAPLRVGLHWAWAAGLLLDGVTGGVLGTHALALTMVAYVTEVLRARLLHWTQLQQTAVVFLLTLMHQLICHWVQNLSGHRSANLLFLVGSVSSALIWPLLRTEEEHERTMDGWKPPSA